MHKGKGERVIFLPGTTIPPSFSRARRSFAQGERMGVAARSLNEHNSRTMGRPQNREEGAGMGRTPELREDWLRSLLSLRPQRFFRRGPGRETFSVDLPGGQPAVVKRYGQPRPMEGLRRLVHGQRPMLPGKQEHQTLCELTEARVSVPAPFASFAEGSQSVVVMEHLPGLVSLREQLAANPGEASRFYPQVLELVTRFHGAGWYHRDLYLDHLVLAGEGRRLVLIDLERARHDPFPRRRWFIKDLAALWHSLPEEVAPRWALRFLAAWLNARGIRARDRRRRWLRAVRAKEARMAKHAPRGGTSYPQGT
mgnify:CR=1 FL=1